MTLIVTRPEALVYADINESDLRLRQKAQDAAERFGLFIKGVRTQEAHSSFYLNHPAHPDDQVSHAYFMEALLAADGISVPDGMDIDGIMAHPELDGKSVALHQNEELGLFVARQVFFLDRIEADPYDGYTPPPEDSLLVDYYAGRVNPYFPVDLL